MSIALEEALRQVRSARSEDEVRSGLQRALMAATGGTWNLEVSSSTGAVDMVCRSSRILIETKRPGGANPSSPGPKKGETQQETSKLDFDKSLWRHVPVPKYDPDSKLHRSVAEAAREMEQGASERRWGVLDICVRAVLPDHATP